MTFSTLFDSNYLSRGIAMYESLSERCSNFKLYIFPFDEKAFAVLEAMKLPNVELVHLSELESDDLLRVKPTRSRAEYCWTCTSSSILFLLEKRGLPSCTYLDADLYFYDSPEVLLRELDRGSVLITEHRYSPEYDLSAVSGIYCVQFITFRNDEPGLRVLKWWRDACVDWCYSRLEDGKFGDQKYLDDWSYRFAGVNVLQHLGGGVAPWNVQQYRLRTEERKLRGVERATHRAFDVVFYHFHYVRHYRNGKIDLGDYRIEKEVIDLLYRPYLRHIESIKNSIRHIDDSFDPHGPRPMYAEWRTPLIHLRRRYLNRFNIYKPSEVLGKSNH
jgi:hypothetical protein